MVSTCTNCGISFRHKSDRAGKYCSTNCMYTSPIWREKQSISKKKNPTNYWLGKKRNPNTDANYNDRYMTAEWKERRKEIYARDNWTCQECGKQTTNKWGKDKISCHHIDYNHKNLEDNNLITLCWSCHAKTNGNRPFWISRFSMERN